MARTALGFAGDRVWLKFEDTEVADAAEQAALKIARNGMMGRKEHGVSVFSSELAVL